MISLDFASLSLDSQLRIDELCQAFETDIRASRSVDPVSLLDNVNEAEAPVLLFELLRLCSEIDPQSPVFEQVRQRRPEFAWIVERVITKLQSSSPEETQAYSHRPDSRELVGNLEGRETTLRFTPPGQFIFGSGPDLDLCIVHDDIPQRAACLIMEQARCLVVTLPHGTDSPSVQEYDYYSSFKLGPVQFRFRTSTENFDATCVKTQAAQPTAQNNLVIDGYEIIGELGSGAFGVVYEAIQLGTKKRFAIKVLLPDAAISEHIRTLFLREISVISQLKHPNIVGYHGFGVAGDQPYLILQYVPSRRFEDILAQQPEHKQLRFCTRVVRKILAALDHAHNQGVVHRDVKMSNVLTGIDNRKLYVKLTDFGLAKFFETSGYSGITASETVCGTVAYMSPEQLRSSKYAEPDCDVYSTAVCMYRMLTGQFPHQSESPAEIVHQKMNDLPRPIDDINPQVPTELSAILQRALHRDRSRRFDTAAELFKELEPFSL